VSDVDLCSLIEAARPAWQARGRCRSDPGPDPFFPGRGQSHEEAQACCTGCEVRSECLEYALDNGINHGVWGGTSEAERQRIRRARKVASTTALAVARLAERGVAPPAIAEQLGVTTRTVYRHLQRGAA
jgi:WhiB family redox-sensing transcriptional regulator